MSRHERVFCAKFFIHLHCEGAKYMNEAEIVFVVSKKNPESAAVQPSRSHYHSLHH